MIADRGLEIMAQFGSIILRYDSVASTNDLARELAASDAVEGLCVIAREQTAGRGRQGRLWSSPPGEGLYLSLILRPQINAADSGMVTLAAAVGVAEALRLDFEVPADIKWPNDVLVSGRKICGILVESAVQNDQLQFAVMGIGVNIAQASFPDDLGNSATSLLLETGRRIEPEDFARPMLERIERWYSAAINHPDSVIQRWEELSSYARGCRVGVESPEGTIEGATRGLTSRGALILELDSGEIRYIVSGEVSLRAVSAAH
ncbi:MAG TPA: biotin--[acetyl-CoA-carboxylase] ligase [Blastocatellia bacterium]|nr:biotin--[acetyl-CoA-carboxylase] ligase [Blastocatellia bacterium]